MESDVSPDETSEMTAIFEVTLSAALATDHYLCCEACFGIWGRVKINK